MDWLITFYLGFILLYRLVQFYAIIMAKNLYKPDHEKDWALALVWVPMFLAAIGAPYEYFLRREGPALIVTGVGGIIFLAAIILRGKSLTDLSQGFFTFADKNATYQLVTQGIYQYIRHPLYLANILLMVACSFFLGSYFAAFISLVGIIGVIAKINLEEEYLQNKFNNFGEFQAKTSKLIPKIF